jgi:hypothetical protein
VNNTGCLAYKSNLSTVSDFTIECFKPKDEPTKNVISEQKEINNTSQKTKFKKQNSILQMNG